ncbi:SDR family NAD(P)-dependent oxidoreductase [Actinomadura sp. CNU-125]|uniref:SDR family NAD(P)-dependent oxidoreductase n=1 Tax=Actinomadura sp. CNU-125 TaxID=1904961 RepID=UPI002916B654|nr:SDR family NAD(P)-dependent oxidoreductase [Actinomadura sp. CNU-125]
MTNIPTNSTVALVTGANKGIGFRIAEGLAARGATVLLGARDPRLGERAAARLRSAGHDVRPVGLDVTDGASVRAAAELAGDTCGRLDVLVNNAGIHGGAGLSPGGADPDAVHRVFDTNVYGVIRVTDALLPLLERSPAGRIVNVSSGVGSLGDMTDPGHYMSAMPAHAAYPVSKAALNMLTVQYAKLLRPAGILVNAAVPGACATDFTAGLGLPIARTAAEARRSPSGWPRWTTTARPAGCSTTPGPSAGDPARAGGITRGNQGSPVGQDQGLDGQGGAGLRGEPRPRRGAVHGRGRHDPRRERHPDPLHLPLGDPGYVQHQDAQERRADRERDPQPRHGRPERRPEPRRPAQRAEQAGQGVRDGGPGEQSQHRQVGEQEVPVGPLRRPAADQVGLQGGADPVRPPEPQGGQRGGHGRQARRRARREHRPAGTRPHEHRERHRRQRQQPVPGPRQGAQQDPRAGRRRERGGAGAARRDRRERRPPPRRRRGTARPWTSRPTARTAPGPGTGRPPARPAPPPCGAR